MNVLVPTNINDITLDQYQRFAKVNVEGAEQEFLLHKSIEIFCDVDINTVSKFPLKDAEAIYKDITHVLNQEESFVTQFEHNGVKYGFIPKLEDMTLGEYIDLEDGLKEISQFHKAAAVMYRPITKSVNNFYKVEDYNPSADQHAEAKTMPLGIITAAVVFLSYRKRVIGGFPGLFEEATEGTDDFTREGQFAAKYGWFNSIYALCGGDPTKYGLVTRMNHLEALIFLEFEKEKAMIERAKYRKR